MTVKELKEKLEGLDDNSKLAFEYSTFPFKNVDEVIIGKKDIMHMYVDEYDGSEDSVNDAFGDADIVISFKN